MNDEEYYWLCCWPEWQAENRFHLAWMQKWSGMTEDEIEDAIYEQARLECSLREGKEQLWKERVAKWGGAYGELEACRTRAEFFVKCAALGVDPDEYLKDEWNMPSWASLPE